MTINITVDEIPFKGLNTSGAQSLQNIVIGLERSGMSDAAVKYLLTQISELLSNGKGMLPFPELPESEG